MSESIVPFNARDITDYGLLLPQLTCQTQGIYTIVTKNWATDMYSDYNHVEDSKHYSGKTTTTKQNNSRKPVETNYDHLLGMDWV